LDRRLGRLRAGLDAVEKRKLFPLPGTELQSSNQYPVAIPTELFLLLVA
jgi:hypothetical protein